MQSNRRSIDLELSKGDAVVFQKARQGYILRKIGKPKRRLREIMDWDPKRTKEPEKVGPAEMKAIWKVQ